MSNQTQQRPTRNAKISPDPRTVGEFVHVRGKRSLRIQHLNPRKRDEQTEKELQAYLKYKDNVAIDQSKNGNVSNSKNKQGYITHDPAVQMLPDPMAPTIKPTIDHSLKPNKEKARSVSETQGTYSQQPESRNSVSRDSICSAGERSTATATFVKLSVDTGGPENVTNKDQGLMSEIEETEEVASSRSKYSQKFQEKAKLDTQNVQNSHAVDINLKTPRREEVLFFIHGVGGSSDIWKPQLEYFSSNGYEIICPDLIGHGLSCAPNDSKAYHFQEILADLQTIFDLYCKKKNVIIGHSYGCSFATVIARQRSRRVTKLVLVAGGGPIPLAPQTGVFSLPMCMLSCFKPCVSCFFKRGAFHSNTHSSVNRDTAFDIPTYVLSHIMNGQWWLDGDELYHSWLNVPTLLVWGRHDKFVDLDEEEAMEQVIYGSKLEIIETAGHMIMMEAPAEFNGFLQNFINQNAQSPGVSNRDTGESLHDGEDEAQNYVSPRWFSPRSKTPRHSVSRMSASSVRSVRSAKSRKSMRKGILTHSIL